MDVTLMLPATRTEPPDRCFLLEPPPTSEAVVLYDVRRCRPSLRRPPPAEQVAQEGDQVPVSPNLVVRVVVVVHFEQRLSKAFAWRKGRFLMRRSPTYAAVGKLLAVGRRAPATAQIHTGRHLKLAAVWIPMRHELAVRVARGAPHHAEPIDQRANEPEKYEHAEAVRSVPLGFVLGAAVHEGEPEHQGAKQKRRGARHPHYRHSGLDEPATLVLPSLVQILHEHDHDAAHAADRLLHALPLYFLLQPPLRLGARGHAQDGALLLEGCHTCSLTHCLLPQLLEVIQGILQPTVKLDFASDEHQNRPEGQDQVRPDEEDPQAVESRVASLCT
mmetsp:Transcript_11867/g.32051  ORF Transcript_11867/g.32051 Transcript_11867/m.32051 type:complete len:331 (-) Transcript_11867:331-1323(-)